MATYSPLIQDGDLVLTTNGQLKSAPDIQTQMTVTLSAYECIYNSSVNSQLIPYLNSIPKGGRNTTAITNIVKNAYQQLITPGIINGLQIAVAAQVLNYISLKITATDAENTPINLSWTNA